LKSEDNISQIIDILYSYAKDRDVESELKTFFLIGYRRKGIDDNDTLDTYWDIIDEFLKKYLYPANDSSSVKIQDVEQGIRIFISSSQGSESKNMRLCLDKKALINFLKKHYVKMEITNKRKGGVWRIYGYKLCGEPYVGWNTRRL
jgi:hypothetical protein